PDPTTAICIRYSGYLSENRFDNYFISFSCGGCANHLPPHWSDITPIRDDSYSFCGGNSRNSRRRSSLPQIAGFRANNSSHALAIFSRGPTSSRTKLFSFRTEPTAPTVANTRMFPI